MIYREEQEKIIQMARDLRDMDLAGMQKALDDAGVNSKFLDIPKMTKFVPVLKRISELVDHFRSVQDMASQSLALVEAEFARVERLMVEQEKQVSLNGNTKKRPKGVTRASGKSTPVRRAVNE
jgi:hypothetical protein